MYKRGPRNYSKKDENFDLLLKQVQSLESGFSETDYHQVKVDLADLHKRLKTVLEKLVFSDPGKYFALAKIVDLSLGELENKVSGITTSEYEEFQTGAKNVDEIIDDSDMEITWDNLCRLEPGLLDLWSEAKRTEDNHQRKSFCKYDWFGEHLVDRLTELLGPWTEGKHPKLSTLDALNLAKDVVTEALPPCRNCEKHPQLENSL